MGQVNVQEAHNSALWRIVFAPFEDPALKEAAREELRRRGQYGEPIVEKR
jgi:hypothetical protein